MRREVLLGVLVAGTTAMTGPGHARLVAEVKEHKGSPSLFVNGKPIPPYMFFGWAEPLGPTVVTLGTEWSQVSVTFVAPEDNEGRAGVHFRVGGEGPGTVWVDDVRLNPGRIVAGEDENRIRQGDWEGSLEEIGKDWSLFVAEYAGASAIWNLDRSTQVRGQQSLRLEIGNAGTTRMHCHVHQTGLSVKRGEVYTYSLWMKADRPRRVDFMSLRIGDPWTIYGGDNPLYTEQVKRSNAVGIHIVSFGIPMPWPKPGEERDFSGVDRTIDYALQSDPHGLFLPRFGMGPPEGWLAEHPDDRMLFDDGKTEGWSMASEAWREAMQGHLRALVRHCEDRYGDHMLGYHPCGQHTGEWFYNRSWEPVTSDFSPAMDSGFARWSLAKYGRLDSLIEAWQTPDLTIEAIRVPSREEQCRTTLGFFRDPRQERKVIDYFEYEQVAMEEPLEMMAKVIKEETSGEKLTCFFYGYLFDMHGLPLGPQGSGHLAMSRLARCPNVDILCSPLSYLDRELGGAGCFMAAVDTVRESGKLWLNEDDTRTYCTPEDAGFGRVATPQGSLWVHERNFGQIWPRRLATWYMDLGNEGWLNGEDLWQNIGRMNRFARRRTASPSLWGPEVALIVDEESPLYSARDRALHSPLVYEMRSQFYRMGAPFRIHLLSDLVEGKIPACKVLFFANCFRLTAEQRWAIHKALAGRTGVWFYGGGFLNKAASEGNMSQLMGLEFEPGDPQSGTVTPEPSGRDWTHGLASPFGTETRLDPLWRVREEGVEVIARYGDGSAACAAKKTDQGWRVYLGVLHCPAQLLRNILKASGVHVYADSDDVVLTDGRFLCFVASEAGPKTLTFPGKKAVFAAFVRDKVCGKTDHLDLSMEKGEARSFVLK